ncbi:hypothetical protein [Paracraurococcus lichenis]|uniref:Flagellar FliJ protein n=1 Tax=Paracraurococcus lichenis TaxID=3064888 RepID=A0ABT9EAA3_9PROT|nr:hypothetical protein [Paracraurococcus sp. LOR1-02]MDO9713125.1 hypothetical protein [Paracraurococcus sp. LOR1-02]
MQGIRILLRLAGHEVDQRQSDLLAAGRALAAARAGLAAHEVRLQGEQAARREDVGAWRDWEAWAATARRLGRAHAAAVHSAEQREAASRHALQDALAHRHRLELAQAAAEQEARRTAARLAELAAEEAVRCLPTSGAAAIPG